MRLYGLTDFLKEKKYSVPGDIAIAGFNNRPESKAMVPALTTVEPFFQKHGYTAVEKLYDLIHGTKVKPVNYVPVDVVIRQSCGCVSPFLENIQTESKQKISINSTSGFTLTKKQKEDVFKNIIATFKSLNYSFNSTELKKLFLMLTDDIVTTGSKEFLLYFDKYISNNTRVSSDLYFLNDVISFFRTFLLPYLNRSLYYRHFEDLLQQARLMVNLSISSRIEAMKHDFSQKQLERVALDHQLNSTFDINILADSLKTIFQNLGILGCCIYISPEKKGSDLIEKKVLCFEKDKSYQLVESHCISDNIFGSIPRVDKRISMVIKPLNFQETKLGTILFWSEKEFDISLLETLRSTISVGLQGALIINEKKRVQEECDRLYIETVLANKAKSDFLANMSHEIRTPLNTLLGLNYLLEKTSLSSTQKKYIDKIKYSAQLLLNNINDLLDYSKIEAGKLVLDSAPFSLSDSLNNLIDIKRKKAREKRLRLTYKSILILLHPPATGYQITVEEQRTIYLMKKI